MQTHLLRWNLISRVLSMIWGTWAAPEATEAEAGEAVTVVQGSKGIGCPHCSLLDCRRSPRQGGRDFLRRLFGGFPWRCHGCRKRFYLRKRSLG